MKNTVQGADFIYEYIDHQAGEAHVLRIDKEDNGYKLQETISTDIASNPSIKTKEVILTDEKIIKEFYQEVKSMVRFWRKCYISSAPRELWYKGNYSWFIKCQKPRIEISGKDYKPSKLKDVDIFICDFFTNQLRNK